MFYHMISSNLSIYSYMQLNLGFIPAAVMSSSLINSPSTHRSRSLILSTFFLHRLRKVSSQSRMGKLDMMKTKQLQATWHLHLLRGHIAVLILWALRPHPQDTLPATIGGIPPGFQHLFRNKVGPITPRWHHTTESFHAIALPFATYLSNGVYRWCV